MVQPSSLLSGKARLLKIFSELLANASEIIRGSFMGSIIRVPVKNSYSCHPCWDKFVCKQWFSPPCDVTPITDTFPGRCCYSFFIFFLISLLIFSFFLRSFLKITYEWKSFPNKDYNARWSRHRKTKQKIHNERITEIAIRSTYHIFCRRNKDWNNPELMKF